MNSPNSNPLQPLAAIVATSPAQQAQELLERYVVPNYGRLSLVPERGQGAWLWDAAGKKYLDFGGGVAVTSLGHSPAVMVKTLKEQGEKLIHCSNWYQIAEQGRLGEFIVETVMDTPGKCLFCNSGAEANEGLIKLARKFGHATPLPDGRARTEIITFNESFHGRTYGGISATGQEKVKTGFEPLVPGFRHLPYNDLPALQAVISEETVAILLEVVQGEGGVTVATREFLEGIAALCRERNILLLFDEVQAGIGRCGHWCAWKALLGEDTTVVPDAVSWAKGIAGGFPFGAIWVRQRPIKKDPQSLPLCDILGPGSHGTTYGGNPLGCEVSLAVMREIDRKKLCAAALAHGENIKRAVEAWQSPHIVRARGVGLLLGFELDTTRLPVPEGVMPSIFVVKALMAAGLLTVAAGPKVVRWLPPLNVTEDEISQALDILKQTLALWS
jgi:acetylornithine/N-succinyldiaminopimelate aminotransferase